MALETDPSRSLATPQPPRRLARLGAWRTRRSAVASRDAPARRFLVPWLVVATLFAVLGLGEWSGWPWLARPLELALGAALQRQVQIGPATPTLARLNLRLLGALRVEAAQLRVAAPSWSDAPHLLLARDVAVELHYIDLWRAWRAQPWRVERLHVGYFDLRLRRLADGRASWLADPPVPDVQGLSARSPWLALPEFAHLQVATGTLQFDDAVTHSDLLAHLSLASASSPLGSPWDSPRAPGLRAALPARRVGLPAPMAWVPAGDTDVASPGDSAAGDAADASYAGMTSDPGAGATSVRIATSGAVDPDPAPWPQTMLMVSASGHYGHLPLHGELLLGGSLPGAASGSGHGSDMGSGMGSGSAPPAGPVAQPLGVNLTLGFGLVAFAFDGQLVDASTLQGLNGRFRLDGPSLAAVGDALGVTLPSTGAFSSVGEIGWLGRTVTVHVRDALVGSSRLHGRFTFEPGAHVPLLRGTLAGRRLLLADLGPALGAPAPTGPPAGSAAQVSDRPRLLPDRDFDLVALRAMDADVDIRLSQVDLGSTLLQPLRPLKARLLLRRGVLALVDLDTRTGQGRLSGQLRLDGRTSPARFDTDLRWDGVQLARWLQPPPQRRGSRQPWVSGRLGGRARLHGHGSSTADILASLKGEARAELQGATLSRPAIELAGQDLLASSLGLLLRGDERLSVQCAVADLVVDAGVLRPRVMVLDTRAAALWVGGSLSLADEALDLRAVVHPKGLSLLALRAPLQVRGSFAHPVVTVERGVQGQQVAAALLQSLAQPLAGLLHRVGSAAPPDPAALRSAGCTGPARPAASQSGSGSGSAPAGQRAAGAMVPARAEAIGSGSLAPALPEPFAPMP
jgi:uncharacterized protein involved in outer membrane biogenesis